MSFPYGIPVNRDLTVKERDVLKRLLGDFDADLGTSRSIEIDELKVRARCGCGKCPTILFEYEPTKNAEPKFLVGDHIGVTKVGQKVGIHLWEREGRLIELEAWSVEDGDVTEWPEVDSIQRLQ